MSFGVTSAGFQLMRLQDILSAFTATYIGIYGNPRLGPDGNLDPLSVIGQRVYQEANMLAQAWEGLQLAYNSAFPSLTDVGSLDNVMDLAGLTTKPATATEIVCDCVFSAAGTVPLGALIANSAGSIFECASTITAASGGTFPKTVTCAFLCTVNGPIPCSPTGALTIQTPQAYWTSVAIHGAAIASIVIGSNQETLAEARIRRKNSLMIAGSATLEAIRSAILNNVSSVTACLVQENYTDTTDSNGNLPHSIHIYCQGAGTSDEKLAIAQQIWAKRAGGINMNGGISQNITDSTGKAQTMLFDYNTNYVVNLQVNYSLYAGDPNPAPTDIPTALSNAIQSVFNGQAIGENVIFYRVLGACAAVPGIIINSLSLERGGIYYPADVPVAPSAIAVMGTLEIWVT